MWREREKLFLKVSLMEFFFFFVVRVSDSGEKGMDLIRETKGRMDGGWKLIKD